MRRGWRPAIRSTACARPGWRCSSASPNSTSTWGRCAAPACWPRSTQAGEDSAKVELAMAHFFAARNAVAPYDDVLPGLERLGRHGAGRLDLERQRRPARDRPVAPLQGVGRGAPARLRQAGRGHLPGRLPRTGRGAGRRGVCRRRRAARRARRPAGRPARGLAEPHRQQRPSRARRGAGRDLRRFRRIARLAASANTADAAAHGDCRAELHRRPCERA